MTPGPELKPRSARGRPGAGPAPVRPWIRAGPGRPPPDVISGLDIHTYFREMAPERNSRHEAWSYMHHRSMRILLRNEARFLSRMMSARYGSNYVASHGVIFFAESLPTLKQAAES